MVEFDSIKIKDQLGRPENKNITIKRFSQNVIVESNTLTGYRSTLGNSWIAGSATNGLVGANTSTEGGGQQVVGSSGRVEILHSAVNPGNVYREHFTDTNFCDISETTADWADNPEELSLTNGEIAQSERIQYPDYTIKATMTVTVSSGSISDLTLEMSANSIYTFEEVTNGVQHQFTTTGTSLRWRITSAGTVVVSLVKIEYLLLTNDEAGSGNPPDTFVEHFNDTTYKDAINTTADWDNPSGYLYIEPGEVGQSLTVVVPSYDLVTAKIQVYAQGGSLSNLAYYLSADGGAHWETVSRNVTHVFITSGKDLRFKLVGSTAAVNVSNLFINYQ